MAVTISESIENIRMTLLVEYQSFKDELVVVKQAEAKAVEAIKKVFSHFDPSAHVTQSSAVTEVVPPF
jgi:hypothetical protein